VLLCDGPLDAAVRPRGKTRKEPTLFSCAEPGARMRQTPSSKAVPAVRALRPRMLPADERRKTTALARLNGTELCGV
jgi:hypothetical protein